MILEIIKSGGPLMVPLIGCAVLSLALIIERLSWCSAAFPTATKPRKSWSGWKPPLSTGVKRPWSRSATRGRVFSTTCSPPSCSATTS